MLFPENLVVFNVFCVNINAEGGQDSIIRWQTFLYTPLSSNPQPIGFSGILLAKRLEVIRWFNQKSMV